MPKVISTYRTMVEVYIPDCDRGPHFKALAAHFPGKTLGSQAHKDACTALCRVHRVAVVVDVLADGNKVIRLG